MKMMSLKLTLTSLTGALKCSTTFSVIWFPLSHFFTRIMDGDPMRHGSGPVARKLQRLAKNMTKYLHGMNGRTVLDLPATNAVPKAEISYLQAFAV